eukprot:1143858-Pelagomonas_calceolata.AAC.3
MYSPVRVCDNWRAQNVQGILDNDCSAAGMDTQEFRHAAHLLLAVSTHAHDQNVHVPTRQKQDLWGGDVPSTRQSAQELLQVCDSWDEVNILAKAPQPVLSVWAPTA